MTAPDHAAGAGLADGTRLRLVGGTPTAAEAAAVVLAVDLATAQDGTGADSTPRRPGWLLAARLEGLGASPVAEPLALREQR